MRVVDLMQFLQPFTKGSDTVKNANILVEVNGKLHDIRRMEVQENVTPIIGQKGKMTHRLVLRTQKQSTNIILPDKLQTDY